MNVRFSYNIDPEPRSEPLRSPTIRLASIWSARSPILIQTWLHKPARPPPQTVVPDSFASGGMTVALHYPAQQTGFTWDEARTVFRWEGQFWIYEREYMPNTGGPTMRWNMRREYSPKPSSERKLYYSEVDKRYHLLGAAKGWLEVGHLVNTQKDLEFRYFDSDRRRLLDTTKVFKPTDPVPVRVSHVKDPQVSPVRLDRVAMQADYNGRVLPSAIRQNSAHAAL